MGFSGIFPERVDPGTFPDGRCSLRLLDTEKFPSPDRDCPMAFREGTEMMTALPGGKFNPFPSCFYTRQGWGSVCEVTWLYLSSQTDPTLDSCGWGAFHAGFFFFENALFFPFTGAGGGWQPGETRLECDKPVLLLVCVNELGLFPSSSSARFSASLQSKFTFRAHGCQHGSGGGGVVVMIINNINY